MLKWKSELTITIPMYLEYSLGKQTGLQIKHNNDSGMINLLGSTSTKHERTRTKEPSNKKSTVFIA